MLRKKGLALGVLLATALAGTTLGGPGAIASDHDDGETDIKGRNGNLTDLYVFTEKTANPQAEGDNLIFVMNLNPRSLPRQVYYYNDTARHEFHVARVFDNTAEANVKEDVILRFEFDPPDDLNRQAMTVTAIRDGQTFTAKTNSGDQKIFTTMPGQDPLSHWVCLGDKNSPDAHAKTITVFAGARQDPFFFDVQQFFRVRASAVAIAEGKAPPGALETFRSPEQARDFALGYNVLSIVARVPRAFLAGHTNAKTFDVWETISIQQPEVARPLVPFPSPSQTPFVPDPEDVAVPDVE